MDEYDKLYAKDQQGNKDLNRLAIEELKKAHYFFAYLRTSEKLYNRELKKKKEEEELAILNEKTEEQKIEEINTNLIDKKNKVLDGIKNENIGKINRLSSQERKELTSRKRYDKFKLEFKDVFDEINEREQKNTNRA